MTENQGNGPTAYGDRSEGASLSGTGPKLSLTEIAAGIDGHLRRMACDLDGFNAERFYDSYKSGRRESMGRPLYGASARRAGSRVAVTYIAYQGTSNLKRDEALAYLIWLDAGNRGTHYQFEQNPSPPPPDPEGERLADGSRPYPKPSDSALPAPSTVPEMDEKSWEKNIFVRVEGADGGSTGPDGFPDCQSAYAVLDEAYDTHQPSHVFCCYSGGHDSVTATTLGMEWAKTRKLRPLVAFVNTGTGIKETRDHALRTCDEQGWELMELHPPRSYRSLVLEMGFPGPGFHDRLAYPRLKGRCFRYLGRMAPEGKRVMLITGIRQEESTRRIAHVERIQPDENEKDILWAAPIWDWTKIDCNHFMADRGLKRNPVSDLLHISGECLCGAMAKKGELDEIAEWFPEKAAEIRALEDEVEAAGLRACRWGVRPPDVAREQMKMFLLPNSGVPMACSSCAFQDEEAA